MSFLRLSLSFVAVVSFIFIFLIPQLSSARPTARSTQPDGIYTRVHDVEKSKGSHMYIKINSDEGERPSVINYIRRDGSRNVERRDLFNYESGASKSKSSYPDSLASVIRDEFDKNGSCNTCSFVKVKGDKPSLSEGISEVTKVDTQEAASSPSLCSPVFTARIGDQLVRVEYDKKGQEVLREIFHVSPDGKRHKIYSRTRVKKGKPINFTANIFEPEGSFLVKYYTLDPDDKAYRSCVEVPAGDSKSCDALLARKEIGQVDLAVTTSGTEQ